MPLKQLKNKTGKLLPPRPPIVVVLGHVDHGKTSILDYIRKSKVTEGESGGITQHIGAYQVTAGHPEKAKATEESLVKADGIIRSAQNDSAYRTITFLDTPGHEAFSAMRSRGAKVADLAVLVVAADEGIKPQTKEAIEHIKKTGLPLIVALNKIDKPQNNPEKAKKQLNECDIKVEELGGKTPCVATSAKTGQGIDELLELILLLAEMEELTADIKKPANGIIIESHLEAERGPSATILVKEGSLKEKDIIITESAYGPIKIMEDFRGKKLKKALPSTPVKIIGLNQVPTVGEKWSVCQNLIEAKEKSAKKTRIESPKREPAEVLEITPDKKVSNLIIKADVSGSLEAIRKSLSAIPQNKVILRIVCARVGNINESDIKLAQSAKATIFGFRIKSTKDIDQIAQRRGVRIKTHQVIYEFIQEIREAASQLLEPEVMQRPLGKIEILAVFKSSEKNQIVGGKVKEGKIKSPAKANLLRQGEQIGTGRVLQLQINKKDVGSVSLGKECGIRYEGKEKIQEKDILGVFEEERKKQIL